MLQYQILNLIHLEEKHFVFLQCFGSFSPWLTRPFCFWVCGKEHHVVDDVVEPVSWQRSGKVKEEETRAPYPALRVAFLDGKPPAHNDLWAVP